MNKAQYLANRLEQHSRGVAVVRSSVYEEVFQQNQDKFMSEYQRADLEHHRQAELAYLEQLKAQILMIIPDEEIATGLVEGKVRYFHQIASSLTFDQFHSIAHLMINNAAVC